MAHYHQVWSPKPRTVVMPVEHWTEPAWRWLRAHLPHLRLIGIMVVVVSILFGIMRGYTHFRESAAQQVLNQSAATEPLPPKSALESVSRKYPHTAAGKYATWLLATQDYQEGNFAEAGALYTRLSERSSPHSLYYMMATEGEGYAQELQGNYTKAAEIFVQLAKRKGSPFVEQDRLNAVRNLRLAGQVDQALALLQAVDDPAAITQRLALGAGLLP